MVRKTDNLADTRTNDKAMDMNEIEEQPTEQKDYDSDSYNHYNAFNDNKSDIDADISNLEKERDDVATSNILNPVIVSKQKLSTEYIDIQNMSRAITKTTPNNNSIKRHSASIRIGKSAFNAEANLKANYKERRRDNVNKNKIRKSTTIPPNIDIGQSRFSILSQLKEKSNKAGDNMVIKQHDNNTQAEKHDDLETKWNKNFSHNKRKSKYFDGLANFSKSSKHIEYCNTSLRNESLYGYKNQASLSKLANQMSSKHQTSARVLKTPINKFKQDN